MPFNHSELKLHDLTSNFSNLVNLSAILTLPEMWYNGTISDLFVDHSIYVSAVATRLATYIFNFFVEDLHQARAIELSVT